MPRARSRTALSRSWRTARTLAAFIARPRGWTQGIASAGGGALAGAVGGFIGGKKSQQAHAGADEAGFEIASPMALAITQRRLLSFKTSTPVGAGIPGGGDVKELLSAAPLTEVDSIEVKRLGMGKKITVTVRGAAFELEAGAGANANGVAEAFEQARASA